MKFENTRVFNFEGALRGMRNPMNSWAKSDSDFNIAEDDWDFIDASTEVAGTYKYENDDELEEIRMNIANQGSKCVNSSEHCWEYNLIGAADMDLCKRLIKAGPEHRKFLRQIFVSVDITAPLYW